MNDGNVMGNGWEPDLVSRFRLPNFLIIGAFKSGTTSLTTYLNQHPKVFIPWLQEPNFFASENFRAFDDGETRPLRTSGGIYDRRRTDSLSQYAGLFDGIPDDVVAGESSPWYLRDPIACPRIATMLPDVKLIAIFRHPADRAFSGFSHLKRDGLETGTFSDAIRRPRSTRTFEHYVETGFYGRQLEPYVKTFSKDQLRVVFFEDLRDDPRRLLQSFFEWFGVDSEFEPDVSEVRNVSGTPRNKLFAGAWKARRLLQPYLKQFTPRKVQGVVDARVVSGLERERMDPVVRRELIDIYADDIRLLGDLVGRDLSHWLR